MIKTFKLKKGEISFETDKVIISDNSRKQNRIQLLSSAIWTIFGVISVFRYLKTGDQFSLWIGLFIVVAHFIVFVLNIVRSNQTEISFDDIKSINVKKRLSNVFLDIKLKNNRLRRVIGIENSQEIEEYIKSNIKI